MKSFFHWKRSFLGLFFGGKWTSFRSLFKENWVLVNSGCTGVCVDLHYFCCFGHLYLYRLWIKVCVCVCEFLCACLCVHMCSLIGGCMWVCASFDILVISTYVGYELQCMCCMHDCMFVYAYVCACKWVNEDLCRFCHFGQSKI